MEKLYIGIDPSSVSPTLSSGGGAIVFHNGRNFSVIRLNQTEADVARTFASWLDIERSENDPEIICALEEVGARPGDGRGSLFKFATGYGFLRGLLVANQVPFETVRPHTWERTFVGVKPKKLPKHKWKNRLKAKAQELLPQENVILATADAYLLALYAKLHLDYGYRREPLRY